MINPKLQSLAVPIQSIQPNPENTRAHDKRNVAAIAESLREYGQQTPIVVKDGTILKGNGTYQAALTLGWQEIAVIEFDKAVDLARGYGITDNRTSDLSDWDDMVMAKELETLLAQGWEHERFGWTEEELKRFLEQEETQRDEDDMPDITPGEGKPKNTGEVWEMGDHRLICGDATDPATWEKLMQGETAQCVFTDPPYGVSYRDQNRNFDPIAGDDKRGDELATKLLIPAFALMQKHAVDQAAFYIWHASSTREDFTYALKAAGLLERQYLIWAKPSIILGWSDYRWAHEPCFYASKDGQKPVFYGDRSSSTVWRVGYSRTDRKDYVIGSGIHVQDGRGGAIVVEQGRPKRKIRSIRLEEGQAAILVEDRGNNDLWEVSRGTEHDHPTQKPVELARRAIMNSTLPGGIVVDPFLGSGTTLIAAQAMKRKARVMELDRGYCEVAVARWEKQTNQKAHLITP